MMLKKNPWMTLAVLALAQFIVVLDLTIVNVALPHIQANLHFSSTNLQWVVSAYTLLFGGFLLLGGRVADLLGRRRLFMVGVALFTAASLVAGLSQSSTMIIVARAVQGLGGAMLSPAALSLLTVTFAHGRERSIAMGIWGALAGIGGTLGVVVGGVLVQALSWRWVFFVNVPIGAILVLITPMFVSESRVDRHGAKFSFDIPGALLGTGGLLAVVYAIVRTQTLGWGSAEVLAFLFGGIVLLALFIAVELRSSDPLVPMRLFKPRGMRTSGVSLALNGAGFLSMFFLTAIFLQQVRHESAISTGLELLPMGVSAVTGAVVSSQLVTKIGTRSVQIGGALLSAVGLYLLSHAGASDPYVTAILPGIFVFGAGIVAVGVPSQIAAVAEVRHDDAGAAGGVVNAAYQIGGALGLAMVTTIVDSHVTHLLHAGASQSVALTDGFQRGLLFAAALAVVNLLVALASPAIEADAEMLAAAAAA
jgi:EmrB/QacA subfamily drug resistance transporter